MDQANKMDASPPDLLASKEVVTGLKAAVEARRELGADLEDHVLEAFLVRVQQRIDAQVVTLFAEQLAQSGGKSPAARRKSSLSGWVFPASLVACLPLIDVAGTYAGGLGVLVVMVALVVLTVIWLEYSKR